MIKLICIPFLSITTLHCLTLGYVIYHIVCHYVYFCILSHYNYTFTHIINKFCYHVLLDRINFCCIIHYLISMCCIYYITILPQDPWDIHYSIHLYHIHPYTHVFFSFLQFYLLWDKLDELFSQRSLKRCLGRSEDVIFAFLKFISSRPVSRNCCTRNRCLVSWCSLRFG